MGLLKNLLEKYRHNKHKQQEQPTSQPSQDIEDHIISQKQQHRVDAVMNYERNSFLYGSWDKDKQNE